MRMHTIDIEQLVMRHKPLKNPHPTINSVGYTAFTVKEKPLLFQTRNQELDRCKRIEREPESPQHRRPPCWLC